MNVRVVLVVVGAILGGACSSELELEAGEVGGGVIYHSVNRLATEMSGTTPAYSQIEVDVHSHAALVAEGAAAMPLGTAPIPSGCGASGMCAFVVPGVNLAAASGGLVVGVRDLRETAIWVPTWTNTADTGQLAGAVEEGSFGDGRAFVVSREAFDVVLAPMTMVAPEELLGRGVIFGLVYDEDGRPISGATVAADGRSDVSIVYPNGMFTGVSSETATQGAFMAVPAAGAAGTAEVTFTVTGPSGSSLVWTTDPPALLAPGVLSFTLLFGE